VKFKKKTALLKLLLIILLVTLHTLMLSGETASGVIG
jgi:hypothetical protein